MNMRIPRRLMPLAMLVMCLPVLAQVSSPFTPPVEKLGVYVLNSGPGLDTGCTFRSGGPLVIDVPVPVVVNPAELNANGTLKDAARLISNGVLSAQATVRFPVFDIDDKAVTNGYAPEVDMLSFNGVSKRALAGFNNTWTDDTLIVPIEEIRFGQNNTLRIDIDTSNTGEYWCMAVDWVAIEFAVTPPYVLQHGINADGSTWREADAPGVLAALNNRGVLYAITALSVPQGGNGSVADNAQELNVQITNFLAPLKSDKVNIIAHSKGGLDSQALQALGPVYTINSLSTLSTPHFGSVAGDLSLVQQRAASNKINIGADPHGYVASYVGTMTFGFGPKRPGLDDLTTDAARSAFSTGLRNNIARTYTIGADADVNHNDQLEPAESSGLFPRAVHYAAQRSWHVLREVASASMTLRTVPGMLWGTRTVLVYDAVATTQPQSNDIVVTLDSANPPFGTPLGNSPSNHGTVKNAANVNRILDLTVPLK